jgi:hypothetical protein
MYIDGVLYVCIAVFTFLQTQFGGDEAAKYITPVDLFWLKLVVGALAAGALALKLYRSTAFADNKAAASVQKAIDTGAPVQTMTVIAEPTKVQAGTQPTSPIVPKPVTQTVINK